MLSADPVLQELYGRGVAERGMATSSVVERLDVVEQVGLWRGPGRVAGTMRPLILQAVEEALARRVVPAIALAAIGGCARDRPFRPSRVNWPSGRFRGAATVRMSGLENM
jgi:hypothetical protein